MKNLIKQIIKESIGKETQIEKIKNITLPSTIEGRFLNKQQAQDLQKEIEANYADNILQHFKKEKNDIRMHMFNYDQPIAEKNLNGINLRITTGLIRNKKITYLLYANGKIIGEFFSVDDIKRLVKYIELNLITNKPLEKLNEAINPNSKLFQTINTLKKDLINAAQKVYNQWEQDEEGHDEHYGSGGICDDIAEEMCNVISNKTKYCCFHLYNEYDCHTSIYVYDTENKEIYNIDIPPYVYEQGNAYTWKKIPDVQFFERNVTIENRSYDYDDFIDEDGEVKENLY